VGQAPRLASRLIAERGVQRKYSLGSMP
jgi:hypothetical protein